MYEVFVHNASTAEKDKYLIDCFHDAGFINKLIQGEFSLLAGRKGTGKSAIARYLVEKYSDFSLLGCTRVAISSFTIERIKLGSEQVKDKITLFVLLKSAKYLYDNGFITKNSQPYWDAVFEETGFNNSTNYDGFQTVTRRSSIGASLAGWLKGKTEETRKKKVPEINSDSIFLALQDSLESVSADTQYLIFIDDVSDYLDESKRDNVLQDIGVIRDVLFKLDYFNTLLKDSEKGVRFVTCVRDDLFEFMDGSNINKLKTNSLFLLWDEYSFAGLLIRRLPHFREQMAQALEHPVNSIKDLFPDSIFEDRLKMFDTKRYATKFYAYMVAISFNRPRDFLAFCYAMRARLSLKHVVQLENIDAAETEYTDYFVAEIRDELYLASRLFDFKDDSKSVDLLVDVLARKNGFNSNQLRTELSLILDEKTSTGKNKIERFVYELWWYGILGFKEPNQELINFRYISFTSRFIAEKANKYTYFLHRGLWWFAQKRKETPYIEETSKPPKV